jgi:alkylation response protein AidB-like acyl-CoA dehydrogenase
VQPYSSSLAATPSKWHALTHEAASVLDSPRVGDPERAGWIAKMLAGETALANSRAAIQILLAMGLTWPMSPHVWLRRSGALESLVGIPEDPARALGCGLEHLAQ